MSIRMNRKILEILKNNKLVVKVYSGLMNRIQQMNVSAEILEVRPILCRAVSHPMKKKRMNLLVPSINSQNVYGGIATALSFYKKLCSTLNCDCRVIVVDAAIDLSNMVEMEGFVLTDWKEESDEEKQLVDFSSRIDKTLAVGDKDYFMVTIWWTAYIIQQVIQWQAENYHLKRNPLLYFIQDYEPGFYAWSSKYLMAESTYKMDIDIMAVFNSRLLYDYFIKQGYHFYKTWFFEPVLNEHLRRYLEQSDNNPVRKKQILIYGRPGTARNAFELILEALREWVKLQKDAREWTILSAGEEFADIAISNQIKVHSVGKLTLDEYAKTMLESKIGISLMVSPHPSYPPLEMSAFGMKVITNTYANKDLNGFNENIISLNNCSAMNIADNLHRLCQEPGEGTVKSNDEYFNEYVRWEEIIGDIIMIL